MSNVFKVDLLKKPQKSSKENREGIFQMPEGIDEKEYGDFNFIGDNGRQPEDPNFLVLRQRTLPGYEK